MSALVQQLVSDGDVSLKEEFDQKMDDASVKVARLFSLVNAGKLDISILDNLIAFAENPTAPTGTKALGGSSASSEENEAMNVLMASTVLPAGIKKAIAKLLDGTLKVDDEGAPLASPTVISQEQKDLEKKVRAMSDGFANISNKFGGVGLIDSDYVKFAKDVAGKHDELVKEATAKATTETEERFKDSIPKADLKSWADAFAAHNSATKKRTGRGHILSDEEFDLLHQNAEDFRNLIA